MRRALVAALLAAALVTPGAYGGPPKPQLVDPRGDTSIPSHDIVSGRLSSFLSRGRPHLRVELTLAAAPAVPIEHLFGFTNGCDELVFRYTWTGTSATSAAAIDQWNYCYRFERRMPDATFPVAFSVRGTTLTWQMPYEHGIKRGSKLIYLFGASCVQMTCVNFAAPVTDSAKEWQPYVVGSDLPRR
ncbi:MAG TPA: hypothetical protein VNQ77_17330 [Frankiaceae bacterium]|nr:hypothetical protein [Frankiaceae bacterium]